jgi:hypothetical protein
MFFHLLQFDDLWSYKNTHRLAAASDLANPQREDIQIAFLFSS